MLYILLIGVTLLVLWQGHEFWLAAGRAPRGNRLERCRQSAQWKDGEFRNTLPTPTLTSSEGFWAQIYKFLFAKVEGLRPAAPVPTVYTQLKEIDRQEEVCVWLGHSTVYIQTGGKRFLFDPVLTNRLPVWWFMRPFKGTDAYSTDDIPDVDYLVITHDHWDHLDWQTVTALRQRVKHVVCALGIGEHFEYWGYAPEQIHELDWGEQYGPLRCMPSRHFSGRLGRHHTLWASYLIDGPRRIFVSGDGGYDDRFARFGRDFPGIDLAVMENGQYDEGWRHIHTLPRELPKAISELGARRVLTYHNSKYALANHAWTAPLDSIAAHAEGQPWQLLTPRIGEPIRLAESQHFEKWW